jgi:hypothetical protein
MQSLLQEERRTTIASPRTTTVSSEENKIETSISLNYQNKEDEIAKEKKESGPEIKTVTEVIGTGVVIEQNEHNEFLNKLTNNQNEEDEEEEEEEDDF